MIAEDMETSSLFTIGNLHSIKTGSIMTVDCNIFQNKEEEYNPYGNDMDEGIKSMCLVSLEAIIAVEQ